MRVVRSAHEGERGEVGGGSEELPPPTSHLTTPLVSLDGVSKPGADAVPASRTRVRTHGSGAGVAVADTPVHDVADRAANPHSRDRGADTAPAHAAPLVALDEVSKQFGSQHVLRDVTLDVRPGETLVVIGESGCGKSVTMKLLMRLLTPDAGTVRWGGVPVESIPEASRRRLRLRFGYLFQMAALFDSLDVYENIAFGLREQDRRRTRGREAEIEAVVAARLEDVGLSMASARKRPAELSGGMRKRVALARALALDPELMLYDEPTTGLDPVMSDVINELILRTQRRRRIASVVVTHDMHTVRKVADRVVMLAPLARLGGSDSQVRFCGSPAELFASGDPEVRAFIDGDASARLAA